MRTRYRISVGGVHMDTLDDNLCILDIQHSGLQRDIRTQTAANLGGMIVSNTYDGSSKVTVTFELHIYDIAKRNAACQKIAEWAAKGGTLTTNDRSGQYLANVVCDKFPSIESARNWTDPLTVSFVSTVMPYWLSSGLKTRTIRGKNASSTLTMDGNVGSSLVTVTVVANERFTTLQLTCGSTMLKLTGLDVPVGKAVTVNYVNSRYLQIRIGTIADSTFTSEGSLLSKLDPSSSDNLLAKCGGSSTVKVVSNGKVTAEFAGRGQWL